MYFYQKSKLATIIRDGVGLSIFSSPDAALAYHYLRQVASSVLLGTDQSGSVIEAGTAPLTYDSYGSISSATDQRPSFKGERYDSVLGAYHLGNGYRVYQPSLRRFTSPDGSSPFGFGGINSYCYVGNDPANHGDPTGHSRLSILSKFRNTVRKLLTSNPVQYDTSAVSTRPARNIPDYTGHVDSDRLLYTFTTEENDGNVLNVMGHGKNGYIDSMLPFSPLDSAGLYDHLSRRGHHLPGATIRLLSCNTTELGKNLTALTGGRTMTFDGTVYVEFHAGRILGGGPKYLSVYSPRNPSNSNQVEPLAKPRVLEHFIDETRTTRS